MNNSNYFIFCFILFNLTFIFTFAPPDILKRFEYKLSFKGPHLVFKDGTIPFWEHSGSAIASNEQIRITPSIRSQKGRVWCKNRMNNSDWEIEVALRVSGRGRIGADGMAIWFTEEKGTDGPVFGSNDHWKGLGVFLDSFDNDLQQNNPYILVMINDGTKSYDHNRDGLTQQIGGCLRDFRNKPFPVRLKIEYFKKALTVYYLNGMSNDLSGYEICSRSENVDLPSTGYYGVSAATGGLADDHDVLSFITHSLIHRTQQEEQQNIADESKKHDKEYEDFVKQLEAEKERYKKEHPEKVDEIDEKKIFEGESDRQFRLILDVQNQMHNSLRFLDSKVSEIIGRQERIVSLLTSATFQQQQGQGQPQQPHQAQINVPQIDTIKRDEVNLLLRQQNDLVRFVREIQGSLAEVDRKANSIRDSSLAAQQAANNQQPKYDFSVLQQINEGVKLARTDLTNLQAHQSRNQQVRCPDPPSCLSTFYFIIFIAIQTLLLFVYLIFKSRSESQAKKFY